MSHSLTILSIQTFFYKKMSAFFLGTRILENINDLKGKREYFNVIISKNDTFCDKIRMRGLKKIGRMFLENKM